MAVYVTGDTADSELLKENDWFMGFNESKIRILTKEEVKKWIREWKVKGVFEEIEIEKVKEINYIGTFNFINNRFHSHASDLPYRGREHIGISIYNQLMSKTTLTSVI